MTKRLPAEFTKDEFFQAFKSIEVAYSAKLKERGDPSGMFAHSKSVLRQFKTQFPSAPPEVLKALQHDFLRRHR
jgi:hypothetical protein